MRHFDLIIACRLSDGCGARGSLATGGIIEMRVPACCLGVIGELWRDGFFFCFAGSGSGAMKFCNDFMSMAIQLTCEQ